METKNGGPAFPATLRGVHNAEHDSWHMVPGSNVLQERTVTGMSLRDYFAAKAMASIIADVTRNSPGGFPTTEDGGTDSAQENCYSTVATDAYAMADAMLAAREVQP